MDNIGTHLKLRRKFMSMTQSQLANRSAVSQASISRLENGDVTMAVSQFFSLLNTLCLDMNNVFPMILKSDITEITDSLDSARNNNDAALIEKIISSHSTQFWCQSPELHIYHLWHAAILSHSRGNKKDAVQKIERINMQYQNEPSCFLLLSQVLNNLGDMHTDLTTKLHAYNKAKAMYLTSTKSNYRIYINILINLSYTYGEKDNYKQLLRHVHIAYTVLREQESTYRMTELTILECNAYLSQNKYEACLDRFTSARSLFEHANQLEMWEIHKKIFSGE